MPLQPASHSSVKNDYAIIVKDRQREREGEREC